MANVTIPVIDLSPLFGEGDENSKKKVAEEIGKACEEYGFFQVVNHCVPLNLMSQSLELFKTFFDHPDEEKPKFHAKPGTSLPTGYFKTLRQAADNNEHYLVASPGLDINVYPEHIPNFKEVMDDMYPYFTKLGLLLENIINDCLGLPPNFLGQYNDDRNWDFMTGLHYLPAADTDDSGKLAHQDWNCMTFVFQDDVGGLEVQAQDGAWIKVPPVEGTIVVNLGDITEVLSNKKLKSAVHKVVRPKNTDRYSCAYFYNLHGEKWVEPLPKFTEEIGERPKYRGFLLKDYATLRFRNRTHPPARVEDMVNINYYAIST